ncbi:MAG: hypothetical protein Q8P01_02240 [bacterium]|nr:hypothetical protein [bacterium]
MLRMSVQDDMLRMSVQDDMLRMSVQDDMLRMSVQDAQCCNLASFIPNLDPSLCSGCSIFLLRSAQRKLAVIHSFLQKTIF